MIKESGFSRTLAFLRRSRGVMIYYLLLMLIILMEANDSCLSKVFIFLPDVSLTIEQILLRFRISQP